MNSYKSTLQILKDYNYLGQKVLEDGTLLIGKAKHIAPMAWLHSVYSPLSKEEITLLQYKLDNIIPESYKNFLLVSNGLNVFNTTLSLYGLRKNYNRNTNDIWQPFDIIVPNTLEKPKNSSKNIFIIGSYDWDGSYVYIDRKNEKVYLCDRDDATPLYEWDRFDKMLEKEVIRLSKLFDKHGREIHADQSTLPN